MFLVKAYFYAYFSLWFSVEQLHANKNPKMSIDLKKTTRPQLGGFCTNAWFKLLPETGAFLHLLRIWKGKQASRLQGGAIKEDRINR